MLNKSHGGLVKSFLSTALCLLAAGCGSSEVPVVCTENLIPAIRLSVRDAQSDAFIASPVTVVATRRGDKPDTIITSPEPIDVGAVAGIYDLLVKSSGYTDWTSNDIVVAASTVYACHPATVDVRADLQRLP